MARHRPVGHLRRAFADHDLGDNEGLAPSAAALPWHAQRPPRAQAGRQLAPQRAPALHVKRLVDGLVADPHGVVVREVEPQAVSDLLWAPPPGPAPVLPTPMPPALPRHHRPGRRSPAWGSNRARQPILHIRPQRSVDCKSRCLRSPSGPLGVPLRRDGPVFEAAAACRRVAPQFARNGRSRLPQPAANLSHSQALRT